MASRTKGWRVSTSGNSGRLPTRTELLDLVGDAEAADRAGEFSLAAERYRRAARMVRKLQTVTGQSPVSRVEMQERHARCSQEISAGAETRWIAEDGR